MNWLKNTPVAEKWLDPRFAKFISLSDKYYSAGNRNASGAYNSYAMKYYNIHSSDYIKPTGETLEALRKNYNTYKYKVEPRFRNSFEKLINKYPNVLSEPQTAKPIDPRVLKVINNVVNSTSKPSVLGQLYSKLKGIAGKTLGVANQVMTEAAVPLTIMEASQILTNAPSSNPTVGYNPAQEAEMKAQQIDQMYLQEAKKKLVASEGPAGLKDQRRVYGLAQYLKQQFENQPRTQPQLIAR